MEYARLDNINGINIGSQRSNAWLHNSNLSPIKIFSTAVPRYLKLRARTSTITPTSRSLGEMGIVSAEVLLPSKDIAQDVEFWTREDLGFRLDQIYPADDPQVAAISGHGIHLRLDKSAATSPAAIRLLCSEPVLHSKPLISPSGTHVEFSTSSVSFPHPPTQHAFSTRRLKDNAPWVIGRAGMHYRDLIPSRLGGAIIASHIRIPDPGPVPDKVHFHAVGFQLIFCIAGWVRLAYEDQGPPFILTAGSCVIQPPQIRHRVLESGADLQVVEIGVPAEHLTTIDHEMSLPTMHYRPERRWEGQAFVHSKVEDAVWDDWRVPGFQARDTGIAKGTQGVASVKVVKPVVSDGKKCGGVVTSHDSDILFTFVLAGSCTLNGEGEGSCALSEGDAFTVPPQQKSSLTNVSEDLSLLEVSLPGEFKTAIHGDAHLP